MLSAMGLKYKEDQLEKALDENNRALCDLLSCLGENGRKRISLFIEKAVDNGANHTGNV